MMVYVKTCEPDVLLLKNLEGSPGGPKAENQKGPNQPGKTMAGKFSRDSRGLMTISLQHYPELHVFNSLGYALLRTVEQEQVVRLMIVGWSWEQRQALQDELLQLSITNQAS